MIIYEAWKARQLPLVGPPVLTGQFFGSGVLLYYRAAVYPRRFSPCCSQCVYDITWSFDSISPLPIGSCTIWNVDRYCGGGTLRSIPPIVRADRTVWEPTAVPLFVLLYLWCVYSVFEKRRYWYLLPMGAIVGVLVQLHYPNIFYVGLSVGLLLLLKNPFFYGFWQELQDFCSYFLRFCGTSRSMRG